MVVLPFTDCPAGTYTDLVTGKTYTGSTIVDAPNQGQVRVLVKDWKDGKIIEDGAFIYDTAAQLWVVKTMMVMKRLVQLGLMRLLFSLQAFHSHRQVDHSALRLLT